MIQSLGDCLSNLEASGRRFYVYSLHRQCGAPFYVGKGQRNRIARHEQHTREGRRGQRFSIIRGIQKIGALVGYQIHGFFDDEDAAFAAEMALIAQIGRRLNGGPLVNLTDGGEGPSGFRQILSPETRAKLSAALTGRSKSPEHVAKVAAKRKGRTHGPEIRLKISEAVRRPESMAKIAAARADFRHSAETIEKIRRIKLGTRASEATKLKMSAAQQGRSHSAESRAKMSERAKLRPPMSEETKAKIRAARAKQPPMSEEARAKCAEAARAMQARKRVASLSI